MSCSKRQILLDSTNLKPLSIKGDNIPEIDISQPYSPKKSYNIRQNTKKDKICKLTTFGIIDYISKDELIKYFDTEIYKFMFWTSIHTKTLGTFIIVKTDDDKMHFICMCTKLIGNNFQYDFLKKCIYTKKNINEIIEYDFPEHTIVFTPYEPYDVSSILSKM